MPHPLGGLMTNRSAKSSNPRTKAAVKSLLSPQALVGDLKALGTRPHLGQVLYYCA